MRASTAKKYKRHREANVIYGGDLLKTRLGRSTARPLSTHYTMHFVLRSTQAMGERSFRKPENFSKVHAILDGFAEKHGVKIYRAAVNLNHLHLNLGVRSRTTYNRFIRAISAAIAMAIGGGRRGAPFLKKFWDRRPFSRIVRGPQEEANLADYLQINHLEGFGFSREKARWLVRMYRQINNALNPRRPP